MASRVDVNEYYRRYELGEFGETRVELLDGVICEQIKPMPPRAVALSKMSSTFIRAFGNEASVNSRLPISLNSGNETEPDISLVVHAPNDYIERHPNSSETLLIIEVADEKTKSRCRQKSDVYCAAGIEEYWILDVEKRQLEIHRTPWLDEEAPKG